jgi:hypothetical protein
MNVMVVGLTVMVGYLIVMALWLRYDRGLDDPAADLRAAEDTGGENG